MESPRHGIWSGSSLCQRGQRGVTRKALRCLFVPTRWGNLFSAFCSARGVTRSSLRGTCLQSKKEGPEQANISCWEQDREQRLSKEPAEGEDPPAVAAGCWRFRGEWTAEAALLSATDRARP